MACGGSWWLVVGRGGSCVVLDSTGIVPFSSIYFLSKVSLDFVVSLRHSSFL